MVGHSGPQQTIESLASRHRQQLIWRTLGVSGSLPGMIARRASIDVGGDHHFPKNRDSLLEGGSFRFEEQPLLSSSLLSVNHEKPDDTWSEMEDTPPSIPLYLLMQRRVWRIVRTSKASKKAFMPNLIFEAMIMFLIIGNIVFLVMQTAEDVKTQNLGTVYNIFETISCFTFTLEYIARVWSCVADIRFSDPIKGRLKWMVKPMSLLDLVVLIPYWIDLIFYLAPGVHTFMMLRFLRLIRILSLLRLERQTSAFRRLRYVVRKKKTELLVALFLALVLLILSSTMMYFLENTGQPEKFTSIVTSMWWASNTLTGLGCDLVPKSPFGKFLSAFVSFLGIGLFALPTGILGAGFIEASVDEIRDEIEECERNLINELGDDFLDAPAPHPPPPPPPTMASLPMQKSPASACLTCPHCSNTIYFETSYAVSKALNQC